MEGKLESPTLLTWDESNPHPILEQLKEHLLKPCGLIGMPTETVYGLAANGLCEESVRHIFTVKGRPLTDPVILHVPTFVNALETIFDASVYDAFVILLMAKRFAPGPITIITRGRSTISPVVSANTMFPAVRCPSHPVAQKLLRHVGIPLAAPSANKFGHISPTSADHVVSEFPDVPILVLNAGECHFGVESTVVKVEPSEGSVNSNEFLSDLGASYKDMEKVVNAMELEMIPRISRSDESIEQLCREVGVSSGFLRAFLSHIVVSKDLPHKLHILRRGFVTEGDLRSLFDLSVFPCTEVTCVDMFSGVKDVSVSPGTMLTHYAPSVPTYLLGDCQNQSGSVIPMDRLIMVDAIGSFKDYSTCFLSYNCLDRDDQVVAHKLYATLRDAEKIALDYNRDNQGKSSAEDMLNGSAIIVFNHQQLPTDLNATVRDRLMRACSCKTINYRKDGTVVEFVL
ncbi:sua5 like protein [Babesia gibsoni]|uniref:Threonylcarbamoyl-AMP synthase n=1 Tax=Babesia gibsoni TaxID=33632 RepID=A0AAD8LNK1_BABGI|nr:sua5 like protein [Babesia gibsoni]